jgi:hypothetical protein
MAVAVARAGIGIALIAVPAEELVHLGFQRSLDHQRTLRRAASSNVSASGWPPANSSSIWARMRSVGDSLAGTGGGLLRVGARSGAYVCFTFHRTWDATKERTSTPQSW